MAPRIKKENLFDGFDPKIFYQMVPVGGVRQGFSASSESEEIQLDFQPAGIARFGSRRFSPPSPFPLSDDLIKLPPRSSVEFEIFGVKAGNATLVLRDPTGKSLHSLLVSVKSQISKSYSLLRLTDMVRTPSPWASHSFRPMMNKVELSFHLQANIRLFQKDNRIFDININDEDLGDPLVPERTLPAPNSTSLSHHITFHRTVPPQAILVDFRIFFVWDLRSLTADVVGLQMGKTVWVEFNSTNSNENALTTAHEIGHALGLGHTGQNFLMAGDGISRSSQLQQFEIDTINTSDSPGTTP